MKKFTIFASGVHGTEAFNMTFALFDNFTVGRSFGLSGGKLGKFVVVTIFAPEAKGTDVTTLRDKFARMSGETATAISEDFTLLDAPTP